MNIPKIWPRLILVAIFMLSLTANAQKNELGQKRVLTLAVAKQIGAAAEKAACNPQCRGVIAIVDDGGYLLYLERLDDTQVSNVELAIRKAHTAAIYQQPTSFFRSSLDKGDAHFSTYPDVITANGGVPLFVDGKIVGAIGESGYSVGAEGHHTDAITKAAEDELAKIVAH